MTSTTPRLFREEIFLPPVREVGEHLAALEPRCGRSPIPTDGSARSRRRSSVPAAPSPPTSCHRRSATPARRPRCSAPSPASTPPAPSRVIATGGGRTTGVTLVADVAVPGRRDPPAPARAGARDDVPRGAAGPHRAGRRRRERPDGCSARERDVRARRHRDAQPARGSLRRVRHAQHAAVDPPDVPVVRRAPSSTPSRSPVGVSSTPSW